MRTQDVVLLYTKIDSKSGVGQHFYFNLSLDWVIVSKQRIVVLCFIVPCTRDK